MNRIRLYASTLLLSLFLVSCVEEMDNHNIPSEAVAVLTATVDGVDTKTVLDRNVSLWSGSESIQVIGENNYWFSTEVDTPSSTAVFTSNEAFEETAYMAVYPAGATTYSVDMSSKTVSGVSVPTKQTAVEGSYDVMAPLAVAYSENDQIAFKNVTSLLKFTIGSEGVRNVTFSGSDAKLSGSGSVSYNGGEPVFNDATMTYVELVAPDGGTFKKGETYYMAVLPNNFPNGFKVEFNKEEIKSTTRSYNLRRNVILDLGTLGYPSKSDDTSIPDGCKHGINYNSDGTVTLVLYDLGTDGWYYDNCRVVGDFTGWESTADFDMNRNDEWGCWWITLENVLPTKEYRFQYELTTDDYTVRVFDPYTEIVYDEWNDKYISSTTYPDMPSWPSGAWQLISAFQVQQEEYDWQVTDFKIEDKNDMVIYELLLRDFSETRDLNGALAQLDYLEGLGITAIELMPVQEFDGNLSWGYNPCAHFALDKAYGDRNTYKKFIDECHKRGIAVLFDVTYNHATGSHPFAKMRWDNDANKTLGTNPYFNVDAPHQWSVYHDFNHSFWLTKDYVKRNLTYLLEEYKIDGFRFDLTKGFTQNSGTEGTYDQSRVDLLKEYYYHIQSVNSNAVMICEHFCDEENWELGKNGMKVWRNMNHSYSQLAMGWNSESDISALCEYGYESYGLTFGTLVGYMESHDEERTMYRAQEYGTDGVKSSLKLRLQRQQLNAAFFLLAPGPKMIWQFGEIGYDYSVHYNGSNTAEKPCVTESYLENADRKALYDMYAALLQFRKDNPRFFDSDAEFRWYVDDEWPGKYMFCKNGNGQTFALFGNFGSGNQDIGLELPHDGKWYDYFRYDSSKSTTDYVWNGRHHTPNMKEGTFYLLVDFPI